jgi:hypothetical protein
LVLAALAQVRQATYLATTVHQAALRQLPQAVAVAVVNKAQTAAMVVVVVVAVTVFQLAVWVFHCKVQMAETVQAVYKLAVVAVVALRLLVLTA